MSDDTGIEWTDATWNPIRGCSRVSEGCRHCYAERVAARFSGPGQPYEGLTKIHKTLPVQRRWNGEVRMVPEHLADPLRWRRPRRVFVNSMSDLFHESLTNEQIAAVFGVMAAAPQHSFQVLTKRARRMREWFEWVAKNTSRYTWPTDERRPAWEFVEEEARAYIPDIKATATGREWPLSNVWLGASVENQAAADERIAELLRTPAAVRWISAEPLLGPVDVVSIVAREAARAAIKADDIRAGSSLDWVVAGCESGPGARPCDVAWLRSLRDQCAAAGVAFFLKQAVETPDDGDREDPREVGYSSGPPPVTPIVAGPGSKRKAGGVIGLPYLDGRQHVEMPEERRRG